MRAFVALVLPDGIIAEIEKIQAQLTFGRALPAENLHLTLAFLGDCSEDALTELHYGLDALHAPSVPVHLSGLDLLGTAHHPALALRASPNPALSGLHDRVRGALARVGLATGRRRFRPHVTLARLRGNETATAERFVASAGLVSVPAHQAHAFALVQSHLHPEGARHEVLASYALSG